MTKLLFQQAALQFLNVGYKWGGQNALEGLDCSGFAQELLATLGLDPIGDQTAQGLHDYYKTRSVTAEFDAGSLAFYGSSVSKITHVAVLLDHATMIEAGGGGSRTVDLECAAKQNAYIRLRPYTARRDLVAMITPAGLPWAAPTGVRA